MDRVLLDTNLPRLQEKDCLWHQFLLVHVDLELPDAVVLLYRIGAIPIKALTTKNSAAHLCHTCMHLAFAVCSLPIDEANNEVLEAFERCSTSSNDS